MFFQQLKLDSFRNWSKKKFQFDADTTLFVGENASGKTNILEAIYLLSSGNSFRAGIIDEMIKQGEELGRVEGLLKDGDRLEITLTRGEVMGKNTAKRIYKLNSVEKKQSEFVGQLRCVLFRPENIEIVLGSPSVRRDYLDSVLEQVDREYARINLSYRKGLRQRNKLLSKIRDSNARANQLYFWNNLLVKNGEYLTKKREDFLDFLNNKSENLFFEYQADRITAAGLEELIEKEIEAGRTLIGPHRDDFLVRSINNGDQDRDLAMYGSRGEQRMAVLFLKILELEFIDQQTGERPVLLLDDIFSELDQEHRNRIFEVIGQQQTILTTTEEDLIDEKFFGNMKIVNINRKEQE
jgi:DNA replication and repair protein RecF